MAFKKAVRRQQKLRLGIDGPSGCGKTMSALKIARGIVGPKGKIAVIDTENESSALYANLFDFDVAALKPPYEPESYIKLIKEAEREYDIIIVDSASHEWMGTGGCLEIHAVIPGNSYTNWRFVTPRHNKFTDAILQCETHIIVTLRSKQTYVQEEGDNKKITVKKLGITPQQRDGWEFELSAVLSQDISHQAHGTKDRTMLFPIDEWFIPDESTGKMLLDWLNQGEEMLPVERQLLANEVTEHWDGTILEGGIVIINGNKIKPPESQIEKLKTHAKFNKSFDNAN